MVSEVFTGTVDVVRISLPEEIGAMARLAPSFETALSTSRTIRLNAETAEVIAGGDRRAGTGTRVVHYARPTPIMAGRHGSNS